MGFKVPSNPNHCVILDKELPVCPLSLSHLPVSRFPMLPGKAGASCAALSNSYVLSLGCL